MNTAHIASSEPAIVTADQLHKLYRHHSRQQRRLDRLERYVTRIERFDTFSTATLALCFGTVGVGTAAAMTTVVLNDAASLGLFAAVVTGIITGVIAALLTLIGIGFAVELGAAPAAARMLRARHSKLTMALRNSRFPQNVTHVTNRPGDGDLYNRDREQRRHILLEAATWGPDSNLHQRTADIRFGHLLRVVGPLGMVRGRSGDIIRDIQHAGVDDLMLLDQWPHIAHHITTSYRNDDVSGVENNTSPLRTARTLRELLNSRSDTTLRTADRLAADDEDQIHHWTDLLHVADAVTPT
jgi:hypothetical protein